MKSMPRRSIRRSKATNRTLWTFLLTIIIALFIGGVFVAKALMDNQSDQTRDGVSGENNEIEDPLKENESHSIEPEPDPEPEPEPEETYTDIRIAAVGDIMFHSTQLESAYDEASQSYDFNEMFEDVQPILSAADMTIANFETTTSGVAPYTGYPMFNSPDEVIDAIKNAGVDVLTTANNHSLDTGSEGLKRTVDLLRDKGLDTVGTYSEKPDSRVLIRDVQGIKIAILAYTESTNGLGARYPEEELHAMLNLMEKEIIIHDIQEAKELGADFIITFMHWGDEYMVEPNAKQVEFAEMMAEAGADLILGSHPHVIQPSDLIEINGKKTYVVYSMGNFISNQRIETLGESHKLTEDGIIINFDIRKNDLTSETTIQNVEYIPTWVYRHREEGNSKYTYRILPIENFLLSDEISEAYKARMERSLESTVSQMIPNPFEES